jgi:uncharacterized protein YndB with AHSA1/START domain
MSKANFIVVPGKQEVIVTRLFDAPRELVFKAYTDPNLIQKWWGPSYLTTTIDKMEPRPGGQWRFIQRDPQGNEYAFHGVYHELAFPFRIVDTFEFEGTPGHVILETTTFEDQNGQTLLTNHDVYQSVEDRDGMVGEGMEGGMLESLDRLETLLATAEKAR